jgi:GT2 family glycosyltransferase
MDRLAIVILNFNGRRFLEQFLPGVIRYSDGFPVYVADNGSSDDSIPFLQKTFPDVRLICFDINHGYAGGYNLALGQIESHYFLLLNSDVEVTRGWIRPLVEFLESHEDYAACQPKMLSFKNKNIFEYAGAAGGFIDFLGYPFCRGRIFDAMEEDKGQYDVDREIFWASGACMLIRSDAFNSVGGFDSSFFAHMEEIDLCWRLRSRGWKIAFRHESIIYHIGAGTLKKGHPQKTYLNFRNNLAMLMKNLPFSRLLYILPLRLALDVLASIKFLLFDSPRNAFAVWRAYWKNCGRIPQYVRFRAMDFKLRTTLKPGCIYGKPILWEYYLKKRKTCTGLGIQ